jgi:hypothetical protein
MGHTWMHRLHDWQYQMDGSDSSSSISPKLAMRMIFIGFNLFVARFTGHSVEHDWHVQQRFIAAWAPPSISFLACGSMSSKDSIKRASLSKIGSGKSEE